MNTLFEPIRIGTLELRNRIVFAPVCTGYEVGGMITSRSKTLYTNVARGGAGLIILGDCSIQPSLAPTPYVFGDQFIPGLAELAEAVHAEGAKIGAQLFHQEYDAVEIGNTVKTSGREAGVKKLHEDMQNYMGMAGPPLDEAKIIAGWLVEQGIESFHVALANHDSIAGTIPAMGTQPYGCFVDLAVGIKQAVDVPVTAVGRILFPDHAEQLVNDGQVDLIGLCRSLLADPEWPNKVRDGRSDDIRYCAMCNNCVDSLTTRRVHVRCALNACLGEEAPVEITTAPVSLKVVVVGGGAVGIETAEVLATAGRKVTVVEMLDKVGSDISPPIPDCDAWRSSRVSGFSQSATLPSPPPAFAARGSHPYPWVVPARAAHRS